MRITSQSRIQLRVATAVFTLLAIVITGLLMWLTQIYQSQWDLTRSGRNSLSEASITLLGKLNQPLTITAYASNTDGQREAIKKFIASYSRLKSDISLEFVDPNTDPQRTRDAGIKFDGEMVISYENSKETLNKPTEEEMTNALTRLGHRGERWLLFIAGHGERSPVGQANYDLSNWAEQLSKKGFKTRTLQLGENPQVPNNTTALIISAPQSRYLPGEIRAISNFIDQGGNLLWLGDPGELLGLEPLAELLGIEFQKGVVVDPVSQVITSSATAVVVANFPKHVITENLNYQTLFPSITGLDYTKTNGWQVSPILDTRETAWLETDPLKEKSKFNKGRDIRGPITTGVAMTRKKDDKPEQRIVVIGDGDFLSNTYLLNGGNLDLGVSIVNWISRDDDYVSIPVRTVVDANLSLSGAEQIIIAAIFMVFLPLGLIVGGIVVWWRRRKQ